MGIAQYDLAALGRPAWNAGRMVGVKKPLKQWQIWAIRFFLDREGRMRDKALFDLAIDSKLRGCDLVKLKIGTLVSGPTIRSRAIVVQQKTGRPIQLEITADVRLSLLAWLERRGGTVEDYAFPSRVDPARHLSTRQYARLVDEWVTAIGLRPQDCGTHSLRRTKAAMIYKATGIIRAIQIVLCHTKIENTVRYLGVDLLSCTSFTQQLQHLPSGPRSDHTTLTHREPTFHLCRQSSFAPDRWLMTVQRSSRNKTRHRETLHLKVGRLTETGLRHHPSRSLILPPTGSRAL
jgi:integrase-like protein